MRLQIYDCLKVNLTDRYGEADILIDGIRDDVSIGDIVSLDFGIVNIYEGQVTGIEPYKTIGKTTLLLDEVSIASNCSMTSEQPIIDKTVDHVRQILQAGGCCGGKLFLRSKLKTQLLEAFDQAEDLWRA